MFIYICKRKTNNSKIFSSKILNLIGKTTKILCKKARKSIKFKEIKSWLITYSKRNLKPFCRAGKNNRKKVEGGKSIE
jgi:hypothetical protein